MNKYNFSFQFTEDEIFLNLYHSVNTEPVTEGNIRDALSEYKEIEHYLNFYFLEENLKKALSSQKILTEPLAIKLVEKRDAVITVEISNSKMEAYLTISSAFGGKIFAQEDIYNALKSAGVVYGIFPEVIELALKSGSLAHTIGAMGKTPIDGKDANFQPLFTEPGHKGRPKILEDGRADFYDLGIVTKVLAGEHLMQKNPPTPGDPGMTVTGEVIMPKPGKDKSFGQGKGAHIAPDNAYLLIATTSGQPKIKGNFVNVEPIFQVEEVGFGTGNIDFTGTVIIAKGVHSGFSVKCEGDLIINDIVEDAELTTNGNIELKGGLIGHGRAKVKAGENLKAKFIETAIIQANGNIFVSDMVMHSNLTVLDSIEVGDKDGRGQIIGGNIRALNLVKTKILGSPGSLQTYVEVGINPYLEDNLNQIKEQLDNYKRRLNELLKNLIYLKTHERQKNLLMNFEEEREKILFKINELTEEENLIKAKMEHVTNSKIIITHYIYAGVKIKIFDCIRVFNSDSLGGTFFIRGNEIVVGTI